MSQTFTTSVDWSEFPRSTPPSSVFPNHIRSANEVSAPTTDQNLNNFNFNSAPPQSSNIPARNRTLRVTKPARKRSRASRRTPTTLLSTDPSNFRAMVQHFTGGPSALGFQLGATLDHPHLHPLGVTDQSLHISGAELASSSLFATPSSGYNFHSYNQLPPQPAAYGSGEMEHSRLMIATSSSASAPNHTNSFLY